MRWWPITGVPAALMAALLFGAATPLAKLLLGPLDPWLLAGVLYLGSGAGLAIVRLSGRTPRSRLARADIPWLVGAIVLGGGAGPVLLMWGLAHASASSASLLLNAEGVLTALIAWFVFHENFDRRIALGMALIAAGAVVLSWPSQAGFEASLPSLAIVGACLAWALDNNLTRKVALADATTIAMLKGLAAGSVNVALAVTAGASFHGFAAMTAAALLGFASYGVSLVLFVRALRELGTARTGAYFSTAPFAGAVLAVTILHEPVTWVLGAAAVLMASGVWLHLSEHHVHRHFHRAIDHEHEHEHDEHHRHDHVTPVPKGTRHAHAHHHEPLAHSHEHFPDSHHRHEHREQEQTDVLRETHGMLPKTILVRGSGDVGSAVALLLFRAGHRVVIHDTAAPAYTRRGMAFVDAIFDGSARLAESLGKRARDRESIVPMLDCHRAVVISTLPFDEILEAIEPDVLVDARMRKRSTPESQIDLAPLTIGIGPNFHAGETTHVAIESAWGDELGRVIRSGETRDLDGQPRALAGRGRERFVYAPVAGTMHTTFAVGDAVKAGEVVAHLGDSDIVAPLSGTIRGLTHDGVPIETGSKVLEVDPREASDAEVFGIGRRPAMIAEAVLRVVEGAE